MNPLSEKNRYWRRFLNRFTKMTLAAAIMTHAVTTPWALAIKFSNQFAEFELPPKWQCALEGAEWVCQSTDEQKKRDAIVVLAAKIKGDLDTLERYQEHLNGPRIFTAPNGTTVKSSPKSTKSNTINNHPWVDSLHGESEIPGFYTRYLATIKQDIAVLVTYSINKNKYAEYQPQFDEMVRSLKVFRKAGGINQVSGSSLFSQNSAAIGTSSLFQNQDAAKTNDKKATAKTNTNGSEGLSDIILIGVALALVGGLIIYRKKKGGKG